MQSVIAYLAPWEFSPTVMVACALPALAYTRGLVLTRRAGAATGFWRPLSFFLGLGLIYAALQTYFDYLSQHMFWVHRLQHLILHHIGPFLLVLSAPLNLMARGTPRALRERLVLPFWQQWLVQRLYGLVQSPVVAPLLFVGLIYFWLAPSIHFGAMLNADRYKLMNWSMALDGILFWWLMIAPRGAQAHASLNYLTRILILFLVMVPQLLLGAYISLHRGLLYDVYDLCGRAWAIDPITDQEVGGLITWIPGGMMSVIAILLVLRHIMHDKTETLATPPSMATTGTR
jgi:putative membrane protein